MGASVLMGKCFIKDPLFLFPTQMGLDTQKRVLYLSGVLVGDSWEGTFEGAPRACWRHLVPLPVYSLSGPTFPSPVAIAGTAYTGPGGLLVCKLWVFQSDLWNTSGILHQKGSASNDLFMIALDLWKTKVKDIVTFRSNITSSKLK